MSDLPTGLDAWLAWQERLNPRQVDLGLERLRPVARIMGIDTSPARVVTVAGTNGKGSVVSYLEALCLAHGCRAGCYISPWLLRYNESVRVAGEALDDAELVAAFGAVEAARAEVPLTAFECRTLAAVHALLARGVELLVLEVGLGGRLDAVNLFDADVGVITSIGLDHQDWLGDTLQQVAREKAGIARAGRPLVCCDARGGALVEHALGDSDVHVVVAGRDFHVGVAGNGWWLRGQGLELSGLPEPALAGAHQRANAAGAVVAFALSGVAPPRGDAVAVALASARLPGRLQRLDPGRHRYVDVAHNPDAAGALAAWLASRGAPAPRLHAVCAMYGDKDVAGTLAAVAPEVAHWYLAPLPPPRGAPAARLLAALDESAATVGVDVFPDVESAWRAADHAAGSNEWVMAFGSFETVRRVLRLESAAGCLDT
jgi:dihydrofolate synthase/folylpolyglutamate synthase